MGKRFFDYEDGDYCRTISDNMAMDSDGNMIMRVGDNMAMDMDSGDLHIISGWDEKDSYGSLWDDDESSRGSVWDDEDD